jgi:phage-related minor tail protein
MCEYVKILEQILNLSALIIGVVITLIILVSVSFVLYKVIKNIITLLTIYNYYLS